MKIPDNYEKWCKHQDEQEQAEETLPKCCKCKHPIDDDFLYEIEGELYCEKCMKKEFRRYTDDFIE